MTASINAMQKRRDGSVTQSWEGTSRDGRVRQEVGGYIQCRYLLGLLRVHHVTRRYHMLQTQHITNVGHSWSAVVGVVVGWGTTGAGAGGGVGVGVGVQVGVGVWGDFPVLIAGTGGWVCWWGVWFFRARHVY